MITITDNLADFHFIIFTYKNKHKNYKVEEINNKEKTCNKCNKKKQLKYFYKKKDTIDGYTLYCKDCINTQIISYRENNREKLRNQSKKYYILNKEKINTNKRNKNKKSPFNIRKKEKEKELQLIKEEKIPLIGKLIKENDIRPNTDLKKFIIKEL